MKKLIALLLALCLFVSLCACGKKAPVTDDGTEEPETVTETTTEEAEEEEEEASDSPYPGSEPLGGETVCGTVIEIPEEGSMEYLGSKVVTDEYGEPLLLSWFDFTRANDYENSAAWCISIYAYQNGEDLWSSSYTYNDVVLDDTLYEDVEPGDTLEVCTVYELNNFVTPVTITFSDTFEELEPLELVVDLSEVEMCMEKVEGISGVYMAQYLYAQGYDYDYDALVEYGYAENSYVELYDDNTGVMCVAGQAAELMYDADCFYIGEQELYYSLEEGVLTVEGDDLYYEFAWYDPDSAEPEEVETESFAGQTLTTPEGYVSITLDEGWYKGEPRVNDALTLYHEDLGPAKWVEIIDAQLTNLEQEMEYTQLSLASAEYEEVTFGENTYQMLYSDTYGPQTYLVAETSTGKAIVVEVRSIPLEDVMTMLESIRIH
ncbi:MAG: DUF5067 domain-containing protein [Oscillospiraceae bacterium]|nr:DUF5067 domain-containing protein [Oscillospiraceae bacterium]